MSRPFRPAASILAVLILPALLLSCSDDPTGPDVATRLDDFIQSVDVFPDPPEENDGTHRVIDSSSDETTTGEGRFICTTTDYRMDANLHEIAVYDINEISLWPGSVVQGKDVDNGILNPIVLPRSPLRVGTDLTGLDAEENSRLVEDPNHLTVGGAINDIAELFLQRNTTIPAKLAYHETYAESFSQAMLDLGISVEWSGWGSGSVQSDFASSSEEYVSSYYCRFSQSYFTASALPPSRPSDFFADGVTPDQCGAYMDDGNPPCWVSSVTYGRIGILAVHSSYSRSDLRLAVRAAFSMMGFETDEEMNAYYQQVLAASEMRLLILGGNATDGVQAIMGDPVTGLRTWIENSAEMTELSNGLPIAYSTHYLKDNRLASFGYATEWTVEECLPVSRRFVVDITRIHCDASNDGLGDSELELYYVFDLLRKLPGDPLPTVLKRWELGMCNAYNVSAGGDRYPDAVHLFDMPDLTGTDFRLRFYFAEDDGDCDSDAYDDFLADYTTTPYAYPDWQEASSDCGYPADWGTAGGDPATCSQSLSNSGMGVTVYWEVSQVPLPAD